MACIECSDPNSPTKLSIATERQKVCVDLYDSAATVIAQEANAAQEQTLLDLRKCLFKHTEESYRRYRNLDIAMGCELLQTNDSVKTTLDNLKKENAELNKALKNIQKMAKEAKSKFADLRSAADKLKATLENSCNQAELKALTGTVRWHPCDDTTDPCDDTAAGCVNAEKNLSLLIAAPQNGLWRDIDIIFNSSADATGIQVFTSFDSLDTLQKGLTDKSKAFEKKMVDITKQREDDLKKLQGDVIASVKATTQAVLVRNDARSKFEGYKDATAFLCCPVCDCLDGAPENNPGTGNYCDYLPRLEKCKECICQIGTDVKDAFCCATGDCS